MDKDLNFMQKEALIETSIETLGETSAQVVENSFLDVTSDKKRKTKKRAKAQTKTETEMDTTDTDTDATDTNTDMEPKWYVILTRSNYEFKFKKDFLEGLYQNPLLQEVEDIFVPIRKFTIEHLNTANQVRRKIITEKIISLYVFVKANMTHQLANYINMRPSSTGILSIGSEFSVISADDVEKYRQQCIVSETIYKGHKIVKAEDPYINPIAMMKNIDGSHYEKNINENENRNGSDNRNENELKSSTDLKSALRTDIIVNIYKNENFIQSLINEKEKRIKTLLIKDRINFYALDADNLLKLLQKYSLFKSFTNLDGNAIQKINTLDLEKLKQIIIQQKNKNDLQNKERIDSRTRSRSHSNLNSHSHSRPAISVPISALTSVSTLASVSEENSVINKILTEIETKIETKVEVKQVHDKNNS